MKKILKFIFVIILLVVLAVVGIFLYFKFVYKVNVFNTIVNAKQVFTPVNTENIISNQFTSSDMNTAKDKINTSIPDFITYTEQNGYAINSGIPETTVMSQNISLTDKECGAILNLLMQKSSTNVNIQIDDIKLHFELVELSFTNLQNQSVDFGVVVKINMKELKQKYNSLPLNLLTNKIPDDLYVTSAISVLKGNNAFEYSKQSKSISINNLSSEDSVNLLNDIDNIINLGSASELNLLVAGGFADALISGANSNGFAKALSVVGATDFEFIQNGNKINFVIKK